MGMSQRQLADYLSKYTSVWSQSRVAQLEAGRRKELDLTTFLLLAISLHRPVSQLLKDVTIATVRRKPDPDGTSPPLWLVIEELEEEDSDAQQIHPMLLRMDSEGQWYRVPDDEIPDDVDLEPMDADERLANRLGVESQQVIDIARRIWGHSMTVERDARAQKEIDEGANIGAAKGHHTRELSSIISDLLLGPESPEND